MKKGCKGDLTWWLDDSSIIQWQVFDGTHHHPVLPLDMDERWRGRLEKGAATLIPPAGISNLDAEAMMPHLPIGAMITLTHLGATRFYLNCKNGMVQVRKR